MCLANGRQTATVVYRWSGRTRIQAKTEKSSNVLSRPRVGFCFQPVLRADRQRSSTPDTLHAVAVQDILIRVQQ